MPARKITINGVSNSFEWQVGNTTRFIRFEDVTAVKNFNWLNQTVDVVCGKTINRMPASVFNELADEYHEWCNRK